MGLGFVPASSASSQSPPLSQPLNQHPKRLSKGKGVRGRKTWGGQGDFRKNIAHLSTCQSDGGVPAQQLTRAPGENHPRGAGIGLCRCWISLGALALACNVLRGVGMAGGARTTRHKGIHREEEQHSHLHP